MKYTYKYNIIFDIWYKIYTLRLNSQITRCMTLFQFFMQNPNKVFWLLQETAIWRGEIKINWDSEGKYSRGRGEPHRYWTFDELLNISGSIRSSCHTLLGRCHDRPCLHGGTCREGWNRSASLTTNKLGRVNVWNFPHLRWPSPPLQWSVEKYLFCFRLLVPYLRVYKVKAFSPFWRPIWLE